MPTYLIEGKKVKTEKPLTEVEIDEIASSIKAPVAAAPKVEEIPAPRREMFSGVGRDVGPAMAMLSPEQKVEALRTGAGFSAGLFVGPALAGMVRGAATVIPALQRFVPAITPTLETGGFRTGLPATASRARQLTTRAAGGAVTGAGAAALVEPEDTITGATTGAAISTLAPPVARIVAKGGGAIADAIAGRTADTRANELIRTAANNEVNALRQAIASRQIPMRDAQPDVPVSRLIADLDMPVLQALLARAEQRDPRQAVNAFRKRESQDIVNELTRIAGGPTAETARAARESAKESLTAVTGPMREKAFAAAAETGKVMPKLDVIAKEARQEVTENVAKVRRLEGLVNKADDWARNWVTQSRLVEGPGGTFTREYVTNRGVGEAGVRLGSQAEQRYTFPGQLATSGRQTTMGGPFERQVIDEGGTIARQITSAADESLRAGARARAAEATLKSMRDRGIEPINAGKITGRLNTLLANPEIATNREAATAIPRVVDMVNDWTNEFGVVTPEALYAIRKNAVAGVIRELNPNMDAKSQERFAARVLTQIKPLFDEAIEKAGGKGFRDYLRSVESGMSSIKGMELADQVRKLYAKGTPEAKQQVIDLVRGESPEIIEELFGSGRYQISKEMAKDMPFLTKLADTLDLDRKAVEQAAAGRAALTEAEKKGSARIRFPFFTRASTAVNEVVAGLEQRMKAETLDVLIRAAQSGREFNRVLDQIPARDKNAFLKQFKDAESWNKFAGQVAQAAQAQVSAEPRNRLAPASSNQLRAQP